MKTNRGGLKLTSSMEPVKACINCRHFREGNSLQDAGECRIRSPHITNGSEVRVFPKVFREDWCGEFERKSNPHNKIGEEVPLLENIKG
jgi:hypothetical protein